jgi:hypothetical protein
MCVHVAGGSGKLATSSACRYCGKVMVSDDRAYCDDVCLSASGQPKVILINRYHIHYTAYPPSDGWVYGETVTIHYRQWVIEIRPGIGGHTLTRVKPKGSQSRAKRYRDVKLV